MERGVGLERRVKEGGPLPHSQNFYKNFFAPKLSHHSLTFLPLLHPQALGASLSFRDMGILSPALTRMGIETNREIAGTEAGLSVSSRVGVGFDSRGTGETQTVHCRPIPIWPTNNLHAWGLAYQRSARRKPL